MKRRAFIQRFTIGVMASSMLMDAQARGRPDPRPEAVSRYPPREVEGLAVQTRDGVSFEAYMVEYTNVLAPLRRQGQGAVFVF